MLVIPFVPLRKSLLLPLTTVFSLLISFSSWANTHNISYNIEEYSIQNGYNFGTIHTVSESKNGLIWLGTDKGLFRFDGHEFHLWDFNDHHLLSHIIDISQDDEGILWLYNGQSSKYLFFDPDSEIILTAEEKFKSTPSFFDASANVIPSYNYSGQESVDGTLVFELTQNKTIFKYHSTHGFDSIQVDKRLWRLVAVNEYLWLRGADNDLVVCDMEGTIIKTFNWNREIKEYRVDKTENGYYISLFKEIGQKEKWFVLLDKQFRFTDTIPHTERVRKIFDSFTISFMKDHWIVRDFNNQQKLLIDDELVNNENLLLNSYSFLDSRNIVWIYGHYGLVKLTINKSKFDLILSSKNSKLPKQSIRGIYVDKNNYYLATELSKGFVVVPKNEIQEWKVILDTVWSRPVTKYKDNELLIGTKDLINYDINTGETSYYRSNFDTIPEKFLFNEIWSIYVDDNNNIWTGVGNYLGVKRFNSDSLLYHKASAALQSENTSSCIQNIFKGKSNDLWFCTLSGLHRFDLKTEKVVATYNNIQSGDHYLPARTFYYLHIDEGTYWLGTRSGLIEWKGPENSGSYKVYTSRDYLSNDVVYGIIEDEHDKLWLSTDYGINSFHKHDHSVSTYYEKDGIAHYECNRISQFKDDEGYIYFGSLDGVTKFHPDNFISDTASTTAIILTAFEIFDGDEERLINKKAELVKNGVIHFYPSDRFFRLQFTLPVFDSGSELNYAWRIDGIDQNWNYQKENQLQIGLLPYGRHILRIKGKTSGQKWSSEELIFFVMVHRPYYLQWWFILTLLTALTIAVIGFFRYRTNLLQKEINKATKKIKAQAEELEKLDKLKSRFFANVSHELRTPLSLMLGPINRLIKKSNKIDEDKKLLEFLYRNTLLLKNLVTEILDLSKLENNKMELHPEPVSFVTYLDNYLKQFYSFGASEDVNFKHFTDISEDLVIELDKNKFEKVVNNFLSNALKFTGKGGKVSLVATLIDGNILIKVQDNGRGIHADDLPHIFDRFYQSKRADLPEEGGTGIGLSLCKELAELMDGQVWAESALNLGSTFYFTFPAIKSKQIPTSNETPTRPLGLPSRSFQSEQQASDSVSDHTKPNILIAEDNHELRQYYSIILSGYNTILTENGQEALDYLKHNERPELILSDLMMPVMDGLQLIQTLKSNERYRDIPFIMLTAKTDKLIKLKALRYGIDDYLSKPFDEEELQVRIKNLLTHSRVRKKDRINKSYSKYDIIVSDEDVLFIQDLENFIIKNILNDKLSVPMIAKEFNMSESTLNRQIKSLIGLTPGKYIQEIKLNYAREMIETQKFRTISQVSYEAGFKDAAAFSRAFKKRFGKSPTEYVPFQ